MVDYVHVFAFILLLLSPVWPLGENPLPNDPYIIINKQSNELAYIQNKEIKQIIKVATGKTVNLTPEGEFTVTVKAVNPCLLYTSPSPRDGLLSRMPSSA